MTRFLRNHAASLVVVRRPRLSLSVAPKCIGRYQTHSTFQKALNDQEAAVALYYPYYPTPGAHPPAQH